MHIYNRLSDMLFVVIEIMELTTGVCLVYMRSVVADACIKGRDK